MDSQYGYKTYADFEKACKEFLGLLPEVSELPQLDGLRKALTLAYLNFDRANDLERIKAYQRFDYLIRCSVAFEEKKFGGPSG